MVLIERSEGKGKRETQKNMLFGGASSIHSSFQGYSPEGATGVRVMLVVITFQSCEGLSLISLFHFDPSILLKTFPG